jgi:hypothetical protein
MEGQPKHSTVRCTEQSSSTRRRSRDKAFRDLLLKISHNMSEENVASLLFTGELERSSGAKPTPAIDVLQRLHESGKFSPNSCANLHTMLTDINRVDLAGLVHQYMDTYPPQQLVECRPSDDSAGYDSLTSPAAGENASVIPQERRFISGSHITVNRNSSEDDGSDVALLQARGEYYRAQLTERACKSDVHHFQSAGSLSIGSQIHGSQVTLEPGAEGLHSGFRSSTSSLHSQAPHININIKVNSTESNRSSPSFSSLAPAQTVKMETVNRDPEAPQSFSPREGLRSAMRSSLHTAEATISEERPEEKREAGLGSPDTTSGDSSTPKVFPMPEGKSSIPVSSRLRQTDPKRPQRVLIRRAAKETKGQTLTAEHTWRVKKSVLGRYIWNHKHHHDYIKCPKKVPINVGCGHLNPSLSLLLYPFGLFDDNSSSMTLQIKLKVPDKCPPLLTTDTYSLKWEIRSQKTTEGKVLSCSRAPLVPFDRGMVYVFNFLSHNAIKVCESSAFEIRIRTSYLCEDTSAAALAKVHTRGPEIVPKYTGMWIYYAPLIPKH